MDLPWYHRTVRHTPKYSPPDAPTRRSAPPAVSTHLMAELFMQGGSRDQWPVISEPVISNRWAGRRDLASHSRHKMGWRQRRPGSSDLSLLAQLLPLLPQQGHQHPPMHMLAIFGLLASSRRLMASFTIRGRSADRFVSSEGCSFTLLFMLPATSLSIPFPDF